MMYDRQSRRLLQVNEVLKHAAFIVKKHNDIHENYQGPQELE